MMFRCTIVCGRIARMTKKLILCLSAALSLTLMADELHEPMEKVGKANGALRKGAGAGDMKIVSENAAILAEVFPTTIAAWEARKMPDAVQMTKDAAAAAAAVKKAADANDADGLRAALGTLGGTCKSCHTAHREDLGDRKYKIK